MSVYKIGDIIRFARMKHGFTQEEYSANICSVETLSRYESSKLVPGDKVFSKLMERAGESSHRYLLPIWAEDQETEQILRNIDYYKEKMDYDKIQQYVFDLRKSKAFSTEYVINFQYIEMIQLIVDRRKNRISVEVYQEELIRLLNLTFCDYIKTLNTKRIVTQTELYLLNNIANAYDEKGEHDKSLILSRKIVAFYENTPCLEDQKDYYVILLSFSNKLGSAKQYEEGLAVCYKGIDWLKRNNRSNYLYNFLYNIGWFLHEQCKEQSIIDNLKYNVAKRYIWQAYYLNILFDESNVSLKHIKNYYESNFNENIEAFKPSILIC